MLALRYAEWIFVVGALLLVLLIWPNTGFWIVVAALPFLAIRLLVLRQGRRDRERCIEQYLLRKMRRVKQV